MAVSYPWLTGWTPAEPVTLEYSYVPRADWARAEGIRSHLEFFDSGLAAATGGVVGAQYVRFVGHDEGDHGWHFHDLDWQLFYLLQGTMKQGTEQLGVQEMQAGDAGYYPGFLWHREWDFSDDWEMIALRVPAKTTTYTGRETPLPERAATVDPERGPEYFFSRQAPWLPAHGGQFEHAELPSAEASEGRVGMRIVRAARARAEADWHSSDVSKWFVVLSGSAQVEVRGREPLELGFLDALSFGPGEEFSRRVHSCSADYQVLELQIPAATGS
jgi:quercetin dioxygenase-like cupin family protein